MNCKNCKHFKETDAFSGDCLNDKFVMGYGNRFVDYNYVEKQGEYWSTIPPNGVMVEGDEGWGFVVGKDFGCIHFETSVGGV